MASEASPISIEVDERHDPPRWVRFSGLRYVEQNTSLGLRFGIVSCLGFIAILIFSTNSSAIPIPLWTIGVIIGSYLLVSLGIFSWMIRRQRQFDTRSLDAINDDETSVHRQALLAAVYQQGVERRSATRWFEPRNFVEVYIPAEVAPPSVLIAGVMQAGECAEPLSVPERLKSDPVLSTRNSMLLAGVLMLPSIYLVWSLAQALSKFGSPLQDLILLYPLLISIFAMPLFIVILVRVMGPRWSASIGRGEIEYRGLLNRRTLRAGEAVCFIRSQRHLTSVEWHIPGHRMAACSLRFLDPTDERLQTILTLWTADPRPEPSRKPA